MPCPEELDALPGLYGRKPPKRAPALQPVQVPDGSGARAPAFADYLARLTGWLMLGNDQYGDCVAVTWAKPARLVTAVLSTEYYPSLAQVYAFYATQNPGFPPRRTRAWTSRPRWRIW